MCNKNHVTVRWAWIERHQAAKTARGVFTASIATPGENYRQIFQVKYYSISHLQHKRQDKIACWRQTDECHTKQTTTFTDERYARVSGGKTTPVQNKPHSYIKHAPPQPYAQAFNVIQTQWLQRNLTLRLTHKIFINVSEHRKLHTRKKKTKPLVYYDYINKYAAYRMMRQ